MNSGTTTGKAARWRITEFFNLCRMENGKPNKPLSWTTIHWIVQRFDENFVEIDTLKSEK